MRTPVSILCVAALAVALVPTGVRADERSDAEKKLDAAISAQDQEGAKTALRAATAAGDERAAKLFLRVALKLRGFGAHEELLAALRGMKDDAVKDLAAAAKSSGEADLRYILVEGLAQQGSEPARKAVLDALDDKDATVSTIAARSSRGIKTPAAIDKLIARLEKAETKPAEAALARELNGALAAVTGLNLSFALEWKGWWQSHKTDWKPDSKEEKAGGEGGSTTVVERLKKSRPEDARTIERLNVDDIIVVKGKSDDIADVLQAINLKHKEISPEDLAKTTLDPKSVLILNCNSKLNPYGEAEFAKIREFVEKGGYLFTSDWQLDFLISKVFPNSIALDKKLGKQNVVVPINPSKDASKHPFLRDVFPLSTWDAKKFEWHIDSYSMLIKPLSPDVTVLVESPQLQEKEKNGAVAVTFRWARGRVVTGHAATVTGGGKGKAPEGGCVLHVLGHFKHQKNADSGDHFALQQLLLNFFLEKQRAKSGG